MQDDYYISDEEYEWRADQKAESLINGPSYRRAPCDNFKGKLYGIEAKRCWLKFTENEEPVPAKVIAVLFDTIKKEVESHEKRQMKKDEKRARQKAKELARKYYINQLFELLHTAKTDLDSFWKL